MLGSLHQEVILLPGLQVHQVRGMVGAHAGLPVKVDKVVWIPLYVRRRTLRHLLMRKREMEDDELATPGLSGWAGYALGRIAANRDRETGETLDAVFRRRQPNVNVNSVLDHNQALAAENARLRQELEVYKRNYRELDVWARDAEKQIARLLEERNE
jgi:hypothetical protein